MQIVIDWLGMVRRIGQKAGPYLLVEMLLPGGTLLALLLFLYRRRNPDIGLDARRAVVMATRALASVFERRILIPVPIKAGRPVVEIGRCRSTIG